MAGECSAIPRAAVLGLLDGGTVLVMADGDRDHRMGGFVDTDQFVPIHLASPAVPVGAAGAGHRAVAHATELLRNGVPLAEVSRRLGHADQNITLAIYSHAVPADSRAAAKIWDDALGDVIEVGKAGAVRMVARKARKQELWLETKDVRWRGRRGSNPRPPT